MATNPNLDAALAELEALVSSDTTVDQSAIDLIVKITELYDGVATAPAQIRALGEKLRANQSNLAAAVLAHTPADVPPVDPPIIP